MHGDTPLVPLVNVHGNHIDARTPAMHVSNGQDGRQMWQRVWVRAARALHTRLCSQLQAAVNIETDSAVYVLMCDLGGVRTVSTTSLYALPAMFAYAPLLQIVFIDRELLRSCYSHLCAALSKQCARGADVSFVYDVSVLQYTDPTAATLRPHDRTVVNRLTIDKVRTFNATIVYPMSLDKLMPNKAAADEPHTFTNVERYTPAVQPQSEMSSVACPSASTTLADLLNVHTPTTSTFEDQRNIDNTLTMLRCADEPPLLVCSSIDELLANVNCHSEVSIMRS
jgi:hypothetical protein